MAALTFMKSAVRTDDIGLAGYSFGGSVALHLANQIPVRFLVTLSASYEILKEYMLGIERLESIDCPTLLLHGANDLTVPVRDLDKIASLLPNAQPTVFRLDGLGHFYERLDEVDLALPKFLDRIT
jgi:pimeloyl-ACP methyl ester carboxylesterase